MADNADDELVEYDEEEVRPRIHRWLQWAVSNVFLDFFVGAMTRLRSEIHVFVVFRLSLTLRGGTNQKMGAKRVIMWEFTPQALRIFC